MNIALLALAIAPGLIIAFYFYFRDKEKEPAYLLRRAVLFGMISVIPAILIEQKWEVSGFNLGPDTGQAAFYAFFVVALSEEFAKFYFLRMYFYKHKEFDEPFDGIVYSVMIAVGFATLENIFYAYSYGMETTLYRAFTAVPSHAADGVIMGYFVGMAKFKSKNKWIYLLLGLGGATLTHGAYDFSLMQSDLPEYGFAGALITLAISVKLSFKAMQIHQRNSPHDY